MPFSQPVQTSAHGSTRFWVDSNDKPVETIHEIKNVNGWYAIFSADEYGKIEINGTKSLGRIGKGEQLGTESKLSFNLETTNDRLPKFRKINVGYNQFCGVRRQKK